MLVGPGSWTEGEMVKLEATAIGEIDARLPVLPTVVVTRHAQAEVTLEGDPPHPSNHVGVAMAVDWV